MNAAQKRKIQQLRKEGCTITEISNMICMSNAHYILRDRGIELKLV